MGEKAKFDRACDRITRKAIDDSVTEIERELAARYGNAMTRDEALARIAALTELLRECERTVKPFANVADYAPAEIGKVDVVVAVYLDDSRWTIHLGIDEFRAARTLATKITTTLAAVPMTGETK